MEDKNAVQMKDLEVDDTKKVGSANKSVANGRPSIGGRPSNASKSNAPGTAPARLKLTRIERIKRARRKRGVFEEEETVGTDGKSASAHPGATSAQAVLLTQLLADLNVQKDKGLSDGEAKSRLESYGPNEISEKRVHPILQFLAFMWNPLSWAMEIAAIISIIVADYLDFGLILALLILNSAIGFWEEHNAGNAIAALKEQLAIEATVLRDGAWKNIPVKELVPGDIVSMKGGDVIGSDMKVLRVKDAKVDQSAITGESLPVEKQIGEDCYSGSALKQGELTCIVITTGSNTFFGKAAKLIEGSTQPGHFQLVLRTIGWFCITFIAIFFTIELLVQFIARDKPCPSVSDCDTLGNATVLIVGGIPIAMPTVLSVTMAIGAAKLAKKDAIVSRLTAVEELAGMDILCSDKTGTLTKNELRLMSPTVSKASTTTEFSPMPYSHRVSITPTRSIRPCTKRSLIRPTCRATKSSILRPLTQTLRELKPN